MTRLRNRSSLAAATFAVLLAGCAHPLPGFGPPLVPSKPIKPEPTCGAVQEDPSVGRSDPNAPIVGAADFHLHQFSNLGFGGRLVWGKPFSRGGIEEALGSCGAVDACFDEREAAICANIACRFASDPSECRATCERRTCATPLPHGHFGVTDPVGAALGQGYGHLPGGYPHFIGWPNYNSFTHQQAYHRWLRRAFDGGMKLIVMQAVSNAVLCQVLGGEHSCNDMDNVDLQIKAVKELQDFIDEQNDCKVNGNGWYRLARTPKEARDIIADGAMAVVIGIEVDTLFNCYARGGCTEDSVKKDIAKYRDLGVRHVFPVHVLDNGFGGAAAYNDFFNFGNVIVNGDIFQVRDCSSEYAFQFGKAPGEVSDLIGMIATKLGVPYREYDSMPAHCNQRGLDAKFGRSAIAALMDAKMIIDVDHMSALMRDEVLKIAEQRKHAGVVSGHAGFTELFQGEKKHEGQLTLKEVKRVVALGGLMAPILHQGSRDEMVAHSSGGKIRNAGDCGNSVKSFAQAYLYAVQNAGGAGVGIGSDMNGLAGLPAPRFGPYRCGGDGTTQDGPVLYPIARHVDLARPPMEMSQAGDRVFDINVDGYAHVGMFPDFVAELRAVGLTDDDLRPLFRSAEAYISMWECTEDLEGEACKRSRAWR